MSKPSQVTVTEEVLRRLFAEAEPSVDGTWYGLTLDQLTVEGFTRIEIHFGDEDTTPNSILFHRDGES